MKKARLSKILVEGDAEFVSQLAKKIEEACSIKIERPAGTSLVMMKTRDTVSKQPFYMGEVLVTECVVEIDGAFGMGVVMGEQPTRAYQMAIIDAAFNAQLPLVNELVPLLIEEEDHIIRRQRKEAATVAGSRVNFDTMEDYNDKS
jgi:alpha-D-ribose 1-methylphosphonate 5-triphosphate synthase subunit PhnG